MNYVTGTMVRILREKNNMTQRQLAEKLNVSDKTISKWETDRGLPDISILADLAAALNISVAELLAGECVENENRSSNMKKTSFYVCPICGNIICTVGKGAFSCCGILLPPLEAEAGGSAGEHEISVEMVDNEDYVSLNHYMEKTHFISFFAYVTAGTVQMVKLYPEQNAEARFARRGHGYIYACCNRHGLYRIRI